MSRSTPVIRPATAAVRTVARLRRAGTRGRRERMRRYFKATDRVRFFGVPMPTVRRLAAAVHAETRSSWTYRDALAFCARMVERPELEAKILGLALLHRYRDAYPVSLLGMVRRWLATDRLASWAAVDAAAPWLVTPLIAEHERLAARVAGWATARGRWVRRASAVAFTPLARRGRYLDEAYAVAEALSGEADDLLQKAAGWLLREAGKTDARRLEAFLRAHGPRMARTTVRYAIERFPPARRRALLVATA